MTTFRHILTAAILLASGPAFSEKKVTMGQYELHYNTFPSTFLSKEVANTYQIVRSKNRGLVSLSILDVSTEPHLAVEADVKIDARNLLNQTKEVKVFKITEQNEAVYYLGSFAMNNQEDVNFTVTATPKGCEDTIEVKFSREFFTD